MRVKMWVIGVAMLASAAAAQPVSSPAEQARSLLQQGKTAEALALLRAAAAAKPGDAPVHDTLASILNNEGYYPEALIHAEAAAAADPGNPRYRYGRAVVRAEHGRFAEAVEDFDVALKANPKLTYAYLEKGAALLSLDRDEDAQKQWALARESDPNLVWTHWYEALDHFIHARFAEAAAGFDKVAVAEPAFGPAAIWRRAAHARAGTPIGAAKVSGSEWPSKLAQFQEGLVSLDDVLAEAAKDDKSGDERRQGEALFFAGQKALIGGKKAAARTFFERAIAVKAPRHAWKIAAERELSRLRRQG